MSERNLLRNSPLLLSLICLLGLFVGLGIAWAESAGASEATTGTKGLVAADFNGDGHDDVVVGVSLEDIREVRNGTVYSHSNAGAVNVLYGTGTGLTADGNQLLQQGGQLTSGSVAELAEIGDNFGNTLAAGDFNGDGFSDLAVSALGEDLMFRGDEVSSAGAVHVIFGSVSGLRGDNDQYWTQASQGIADKPEQDDLFGSSLAVGDFGWGPQDDLAIGAFGEDLYDKQPTRAGSAGAVTVLQGTKQGPISTGSLFLTQDTPGMKGESETFDIFGWRLAAGDFGQSPHDDLVIGIDEDFDDDFLGGTEGSVEIIYGSDTGLVPETSKIWHRAKPGIKGSAEPGDRFSRSLTAGDFDGDSYLDLGVGSQDDIPTTEGFANSAGAVNVIYGSASGLTKEGNQLWHQDSAGIEDAVEPGDAFGAAITAADFGNGLQDDLVIGVPLEDFDGISDPGALHVIYGSPSGLSTTGTQFWSQDSDGVLDEGETTDFFGSALTAGEIDDEGAADLVVGAEAESFEEVVAAGAINVLFSNLIEISGDSSEFWHQDSPGIQSRAEDDDEFSNSQIFPYL